MANWQLKSFYESDIAMLEHEFITNSFAPEAEAEKMTWYLAGAHDFAQRLIEEIRGKAVE